MWIFSYVGFSTPNPCVGQWSTTHVPLIKVKIVCNICKKKTAYFQNLELRKISFFPLLTWTFFIWQLLSLKSHNPFYCVECQFSVRTLFLNSCFLLQTSLNLSRPKCYMSITIILWFCQHLVSVTCIFRRLKHRLLAEYSCPILRMTNISNINENSCLSITLEFQTAVACTFWHSFFFFFSKLGQKLVYWVY